MEPEVTTETGAPSAPPITEASTRVLSELTQAERHEWRKTGELPKAATATSAPAEVVKDPPASTDAVNDKLDPEPSEYKTKTAARINDLLTKASRAEARADKLERELAALRPQMPTAASSTATEKRPNSADYQDIDQYFEDLADWKATQLLSKRDADLSERSQRAHADAEATRMRAYLQSKWDAGAAKHEDFAQVAGAETKIEKGSAIDVWILDADDGFEVLYHLQKNPTELAKIQALTHPDGSPYVVKQLTALALLGQKLTAAPVVKLKTTAPDPSPTLGTKGTEALDDVQRALKSGDAAAYRRAKNREELAAKRH